MRLDEHESQDAARDAARQLRAHLLTVAEGTHLGSEEEIRGRFNLSRATLRQAARILEHEQLLSVRRGVGGGYFTRRPSVKTVARSAATYLQAHHATMTDVVRIAQIFSMETARLAAASTDEAGRARLADLRADLITRSDEDYGPAEVIRDEQRVMDALLDLADAPTLALFQRILHEFGRRERTLRIFHSHPERCHERRLQRIALLDAVLTQDADMAALLARRQNELSQAWMESDLSDAADLKRAIAAE